MVAELSLFAHRISSAAGHARHSTYTYTTHLTLHAYRTEPTGHGRISVQTTLPVHYNYGVFRRDDVVRPSGQTLVASWIGAAHSMDGLAPRTVAAATLA